MTHDTDMISRAEANRQTQEALALWACDITQIAPIILNTIEVERMKWEDNPQIKRGEVPPETITLSMFEACLRALIDTDTLARLEARETAIQQQAYQKGYEDGARAEYESQALAAIRKGET